MKCKSCGQEGFKNPREIVVHKKNSCGIKIPTITSTDSVPDQANVVTEIQPTQTINPDVEAKIQEAWQKKLDNPVVSQSPALQPIPVETEVATASIPEVNQTKQNLMQIFNELKTAEGKSVISIMLVQQKVEEMTTNEIFNYLFTKISDGNERAILRKFFI